MTQLTYLTSYFWQFDADEACPPGLEPVLSDDTAILAIAKANGVKVSV